MRLFFITSGSGFSFSPTLSDEDDNIVRAFHQLERERPGFSFKAFYLRQESIGLLLPRIRAFRPDVVLVFKGVRFPEQLAHAVRKAGYRIGVWLVDDPYRLQTHVQLVRPYSFVLTQEASCVPFYRSLKKVAFHLPLAVDPKKYYPISNIPHKYRSDVCFIGSGFPVRITMIDKLAPYLRNKRFILIGQWWERLRSYPYLRHRIINKPIPPSEVVKYYNGAKIVLNIHRTPNDRMENFKYLPATTPNNRTFEIAGCRAFQLTSARKELPRYYKENEMISFNGWKDLQNKIDYYLRHEEERESIAKRAYRRTWRDHTYKARLEYLIKRLNGRLQKDRKK